MHIRVATSDDRTDVHGVYWSAFGEDERELVAKLAVDLLSEIASAPVFSLIAECEDVVVGHLALSPVTIDNEDDFLGYILAPLGVRPDYQKRRIGSQLVEFGIQHVSRLGADILFVYGDPNYYGKFGFNVEAASRFVPPYKLQYPLGWQGIAFRECTMARPRAKIACVASLCDPALW